MLSIRPTWYRQVSALRRRWVALVAAAAVLATAGCTLTGCGGVAETSWSPDATSIAYSVHGKLRIYDLATKQSRGLDVGEVDVFAPSWSPDGKAIAFYSVTWGEKAAVALQAVELSSGRVRTLAPEVWPLPRTAAEVSVEPGRTADEALLEAQQVSVGWIALMGVISWSPDSKQLACMGAQRSSGGGLLINYATGEAKAIVEGPQTIKTLAWSPDGKTLAYVALPASPSEVVAQSGSESNSNEPLPSLWLHDFAAGTEFKLYDFAKDAYVEGARLEWSEDSEQIGFLMNDPHYHGRTIGCLIDARPGSAVRERVRGLTEAAVWAPGLKGAAFPEDRQQGEVVLIYIGLMPRTRRVLGALPAAALAEQEVQSEASGDSTNYSRPTFSPDGGKIALRVGEEEAARIVVFDVP